MIEKSSIMKHDWIDCGINGNHEYVIVRKITGAKVRVSNGKQYDVADLNGIPLTIENLYLNGYIQESGKLYNPDKSRFPVFYLKNGLLTENRIFGQYVHTLQHKIKASGLTSASYLWKVYEDDNDYQQTRLTEQILLDNGFETGIDSKGRSVFSMNEDNWWILHNEGSIAFTLVYDDDYLSCWHVEKLQQYFDVLGIDKKLVVKPNEIKPQQVCKQTINIVPIETEYHGCKFRSRLEARWAVFFDQIGIEWEYEPQGYELGDGLRYLPDFCIRNVLLDNDTIDTLFVEIKGNMTQRDEEKIYKISKYNPILVLGDIPDYNNVEKSVTRYWDGVIFSLLPISDKSRAFVYPTYDYTGRLRLKTSWDEFTEERTKKAYKIARQARFEFGETPKY